MDLLFAGMNNAAESPSGQPLRKSKDATSGVGLGSQAPVLILTNAIIFSLVSHLYLRS